MSRLSACVKFQENFYIYLHGMKKHELLCKKFRLN